MFSKILIANRGEIACRIAVTARRLGIETVAVYSNADAQAKHVTFCDQAAPIGGNSPQDSYLQWQRIIDAALQTGAQAIHPGYGFLSENHAFASACLEHNIVFIGPPPESIQAMGLKAQSKQLMMQAGVPLVPGYHGQDQSPERLQAEAQKIGYPVLIKASAGGGGKGMRLVSSPADFMPALESCQREAANSFDNDTVLIEKYVQQPRHIEVQIFADTQGHCIHLFERDCSVQRRHQKIIEESPAPGLTEPIRQQMGKVAVEAAQAVGYVGAGTVEFIVEQPTGYDQPQDMRFYFMEMNTRLQVEHPVTEAITGIDLVEWQLRVAFGEPLPLRQEHVHIHGHAIEVRVCAENPNKQFMPSTGTVSIYKKPPHRAFELSQYDDQDAGIRFDDAINSGDTITPFYDAMIGKVIVHGATRAESLSKLNTVLAATHLVGLTTNIEFLRDVINTASFANARLDTELIEREAQTLFGQEKITPRWAVAAAVSHLLQTEKGSQTLDPFSVRDGWRSLSTQVRRLDFMIQDHPIDASLIYGDAGKLTLQIGDQTGPLYYRPIAESEYEVTWCQQRRRFSIYENNLTYTLFFTEGMAQITRTDPLAQTTQANEMNGTLEAPMPASVVSFLVEVGDTVTKGQPLVVIEAMKMEHTIQAPTDGKVETLLFSAGDRVQEGSPLLKLHTADTPSAQRSS